VLKKIKHRSAKGASEKEKKKKGKINTYSYTRKKRRWITHGVKLHEPLS